VTAGAAERSGVAVAHGRPAADAWASARAGRRSRTGLSQRLRALALPTVAFGFYAAIGWKVVLLQHVVVADGWARLAHAYFVFYNHPAKLAAIGFIWPPNLTLVFLAFAWLKPLATSLLALPLMSAVFATGVVLFLDRTLALTRMPARLRYPLIAAFGLNPMVLFYATNGMGEMVSLFFLTVELYALMSWYLSRQMRYVVLLSLALTLGFLSRYEMILWAGPATLVIFGTMLKERVRFDQLEAWLIAFVAPIAYGIGVWLLTNWLIMGTPFYWLRAETSSETGVTVTAPTHPSPTAVLDRVVSLNAHLYFPTLLALVAIVVAFAFRRDVMTAGLAAFLAINGLFSAVLFYVSDNLQYLELRYNIRPIPIVLACVGWLYLMARSRRERVAIWCISLVALVAASPFTWHTMATSKSGFLEDSFLQALPNTRDATGYTGHVLGSAVRLGVDNERAMAAYIHRHVSGRNSILTDDAASFAVMLFDGRPSVYWDRIDKGDAAWRKALKHPSAKVHYLLVSPRSAAGASDLALQRYPAVARGDTSRFKRVYGNRRYVLLRIVARNPHRAKFREAHPR
jgi:hypothetical protein